MASPMPVSPAIAPITPPAAVPMAEPLKVRCSVSDMPAHPARARLITNKMTIDSFFMVNSFLNNRFSFARPLFDQKPKLSLNRRLVIVLRTRLGPFDELVDRFIAGRLRNRLTDKLQSL